MEQLVTAITSFITWLQIPAVVCYALALCLGGYEMLYVGGEQGTAKGKRTFVIATVAFVIIKGANALATSLGGKINF
ncbi:hypothetical protein [Clostridium tyrobutyricum]|jgi:hypothetical protein|uniref:hypothetical protein n=1 Tax=Clostridium tyrobutyricum TaxID=1519 RepID=UPI00242DADDF|nr:hypothetical protein [Clostridium tyrobutyricum]